MRRTPSSVERGRKFSLDSEALKGYTPSETEDAEEEAPIWGAFRQKIFSFIRSRSRSPSNKSPGSKSPVNRSPTGFKSPFSCSPTNKSPISGSPSNRSSSSKSPPRYSPSLRSPTTTTPSRNSPCGTPPLKSPPPTCTSNRERSFSKSSQDSRSSSGEAELLFVNSRRNSMVMAHNVKKNMGLSLSREKTDSIDSSSGTPGTNSPGTPLGRKSKFKNKGSPGEYLDFQKMDDDLRFAEAALRPRKWSYHGAASPSTQVEAPKRHSFSTASGHKTGIVVSNNDLAKLLGQNRLLLPGLPLSNIAALPSLPDPKKRGRSQSIAVCAQSAKAKPLIPIPIAPVLIKTIDCDHICSIHSLGSMDSEKDDEYIEKEQEKLLWDSSGSTVNVNLLGSVIEKYLKTSGTQEDGEQEAQKSSLSVSDPKKDTPKDSLVPAERERRDREPPFKDLQVQ